MACPAPRPPAFSHALTPSPALLFRFSALTFNAHAIHLDPGFARVVEGHRAPLVHGPLTLALLLAALDCRLRETGRADRTVAALDYRNLAPLYAGEELRLCGREADADGLEVWVEGPDGGLAVRGTAVLGTV